MLQGTLNVFSLDEVLGLLSSAGKTGVLNIDGDRGAGSLSLRDGSLAGATAAMETGDGSISSVVFELLRFESGSFGFDADGDVGSGDSRDVEPVLVEAHERLDEWRTIEAVVPSLDRFLTLNPDIGNDQVKISPEEWTTIVAVGEGATVGEVAGRLELGEVDGSRQVKGLIERCLVNLGDEAVFVPMAESTPPPIELPSRRSAAPIDVEPSVPEYSEFESAVTEAEGADPAGFETPAVESPVAEIPVVETPVADSPVIDTPAVDSEDESTAIDSAPESAAPEFAAQSFDTQSFNPPSFDPSEIPPMPAPPSMDEIDAAGLLDDSAADMLDESISAMAETVEAPVPPTTEAELSPSNLGFSEAAAPAFEAQEFETASAFENASAFEDSSSAEAFVADTFVSETASVSTETPMDELPPIGSAEFESLAFDGSSFDMPSEDPSPAVAVESDEEAVEEKSSESGSLLMRYLKSNG